MTTEIALDLQINNSNYCIAETTTEAHQPTPPQEQRNLRKQLHG